MSGARAGFNRADGAQKSGKSVGFYEIYSSIRSLSIHRNTSEPEFEGGKTMPKAKFITMVFLLVCLISDAYSQKTDSGSNVAPGGRQQLKGHLAPEASKPKAIGRVPASTR